MGKRIKKTANSFDKNVKGISNFQKVLKASGFLKAVDVLVKNHFPNMCKSYKLVNGDKKAISKVFKTMAVNIDGISKPHIDGLDYDEGMCLVFPFGLYQGIHIVYICCTN
jgi:hypothetical protein